MKIEVQEDGTLMIDDTKTEISQLTQSLLEKIVEESLDSKVIYSIDGDMPIARFFTAIDKGTCEESDLRKMKAEADELERKTVEKGREFVEGTKSGD